MNKGKLKNKNGITLIALIITIIVILILVTITITVAVNGGLFNYTGNAVGDTKNAIEVEQKLAEGRVKIGDLWYSSIEDYLNNNPINVETGAFVEYGVAYKDAFISKDYTTTNGWRLLDYTDNGDGTISNVKLISTGIPAKLNYYYKDTTTNKAWWITNEAKLEEFKEVLGGDEYSFYTGTETYYVLQATAGMYYNFGEIKFAYGTSNRGNNLGYFDTITVGGTTYGEENTEEKTGNDLFKVGNNVETVRLLTLKELNEGLERTDIDSTSQITTDSKGLYRLDRLINISGMSDYSYSMSGDPYSMSGDPYSIVCYWLASPYSSSNDSLCDIQYNGYVFGCTDEAIFNNYGLRPVVCLKSDIKYTVNTGTDTETGITYLTLTT